jgi:predicted transcriptional regulator
MSFSAAEKVLTTAAADMDLARELVDEDLEEWEKAEALVELTAIVGRECAVCPAADVCDRCCCWDLLEEASLMIGGAAELCASPGPD